jgi:hypothetical protein
VAFDFPASPVLGQTFAALDKIYTWNGYAWDLGFSAAVSAGYVQKSGDTMTGPLTLNADPIAPLVGATKQYVDRAVPPAGNDGEALVVLGGVAMWGAPIEGGNF